MKKFCLFWAALCLVAAVATACGGGSSTTGQPYGGTTTYGDTTTATTEADAAPAAAGAATITIDNFSYGEPLTVSPGATVSVTNNDSAPHSVTSQTAGQFDAQLEGNGQATFTAPTQPGEYAFYCTYHPSMKGTLIVQ
jgi:plastocyanin